MYISATWAARLGHDAKSRREQSGIADLRDYSAAYSIWGDGPPLVLLPGLAGGIDLVRPLALELAKSYRVFAYHSRGEDDRFALRRRFGLNELADDLIEFIKWMGLERPAVFGVSFGGGVALRAAVRRPYHFSSVIAQGVGARFERGLLQRVAGLVLSTYPLPTDNPFINQFLNLLFGGKKTPRPLVNATARTCWQTDQAVIAYRMRMLRRVDLRDGADRPGFAPLLLTGSRDVVVSPRNTRALAQVVPASYVHEFADCGHLACVSHPRLLADVVRQFVPVR